MQILESHSFGGYRRSSTPREVCVGLLKSVTGEEIVLSLVDPTTSSDTSTTSSSPQTAAVNPAVVAANADLDIEFVLSSSSSAWSSSFSSFDSHNDKGTEAQQENTKALPATAPGAPPQRPSHGSVFRLAQGAASSSSLAETMVLLRRAYGAEATSLWWVLLGYSASGDCLYLCPHHTRLAAVQSATAAVASPIWCVPTSTPALFVPQGSKREGLLVDITARILSSDETLFDGSLGAAARTHHHFIRVPVGCCANPSADGASDLIFVLSPPLDTTLLASQFGVSGCPREGSCDVRALSSGPSAQSRRNTYVLSKTDRTPVQFLGVALGVPWVVNAEGAQRGSQPQELRDHVSSGDTHVAASRADGPTFLDFADPLPGCYHTDSLVREFGLRGSQPPPPMTSQTQAPAGALASAVASLSYTDALTTPTALAAAPSASSRHTLSDRANTAAAASSTSPPPPERPTSLPYFVKGRRVAVPGPFGVLLECDVSPAALDKKFGVAHGDRLRLRDPATLQEETLSPAEWEELDVSGHTTHEGPLCTQPPLYVTVMGVAMSAPVVLFDDARKAVMLRTVRGVDGMHARFVKISGTALPPPALPIETEDVPADRACVEGASSTAVAGAGTAAGVPSAPPPHAPSALPHGAAYDDFRSSTSSSEADEPTEAASPSATPSQLPDATQPDDADDTNRRNLSLAPTDLMSTPAAPNVRQVHEAASTPRHAANPIADVPVPPDSAADRADLVGESEIASSNRAENSNAGESDDTVVELAAPAAALSEAETLAEQRHPRHRRESSASPAIVLPTADDAYAAPSPSMPESAPQVDGSRAMATSSGTESHSLTDFLKAYALYQLERDDRLAGHETARRFTIRELQQYYQVQPLKRVLSAMEAQRRCQWLWGREGMFDSAHSAQLTWAELCVDEVAEYLLAKEAVLAAMVAR